MNKDYLPNKNPNFDTQCIEVRVLIFRANTCWMYYNRDNQLMEIAEAEDF